MPRPSGPSRSFGKSQSRLYFSGPNGEIGDVIDDSSEGLPVSVFEHDLVDSREASLIAAILAHLACGLMKFGGPEVKSMFVC